MDLASASWCVPVPTGNALEVGDQHWTYYGSMVKAFPNPHRAHQTSRESRLQESARVILNPLRDGLAGNPLQPLEPGWVALPVGVCSRALTTICRDVTTAGLSWS